MKEDGMIAVVQTPVAEVAGFILSRLATKMAEGFR
jgi:hypothetical protein